MRDGCTSKALLNSVIACRSVKGFRNKNHHHPSFGTPENSGQPAVEAQIMGGTRT